MTENGGQMTIYFSSSDGGQGARLFVEKGADARPEFRKSRNAFVQYCINFTKQNDVALGRDIKRIATKK